MKKVEGGAGLNEKFNTPESVTNAEIKALKNMEGMKEDQLAKAIGEKDIAGLRDNLIKELAGYSERKAGKAAGGKDFSKGAMEVVDSFTKVINKLDGMISKAEKPVVSNKPSSGEGADTGAASNQKAKVPEIGEVVGTRTTVRELPTDTADVSKGTPNSGSDLVFDRPDGRTDGGNDIPVAEVPVAANDGRDLSADAKPAESDKGAPVADATDGGSPDKSVDDTVFQTPEFQQAALMNVSETLGQNNFDQLTQYFGLTLLSNLPPEEVAGISNKCGENLCDLDKQFIFKNVECRVDGQVSDLPLSLGKDGISKVSVKFDEKDETKATINIANKDGTYNTVELTKKA